MVTGEVRLGRHLAAELITGVFCYKKIKFT